MTTDFRFVISARDCLFDYNFEYNVCQVVPSTLLIESKVEEVIRGAEDTIDKFGVLTFERFVYRASILQAAMIFSVTDIDKASYLKFKLSHPDEYDAIKQLSEFYMPFQYIMNRDSDDWVILDSDLQPVRH